MFKKFARVLSLVLVITLLMSAIGASAGTYKNKTTWRMVTCGDKLLRKTALYVRNTSTGRDAPSLVLTVTQKNGCGSSRNICVIGPNSTGKIIFYTYLGNVGDIRFTISPSGMSNKYSCTMYNGDGSPIVKVG